MQTVPFVIVVQLSVILQISCIAAIVISTPGVQWSRDNSAVQLIWRLDEDEIVFGNTNVEKDNFQILRYDRFDSDSNLIHPNFTNRVTVIDSNDSAIYLFGINISPMSIFDYGDYCAVFHTCGESCGATVVILGEPSSIDLSGALEVVVGDDVTLRCAAMSRTLPTMFAPVMTYMWIINGTTYSPGDDAGLPERHSFRDADGQLNKQLVIALLERDDIYEYTCQARENGSSFTSEQSITYSLFPHFPPGSAQPSEKQLTINATNDVTLTCIASELGRPRGSWVWRKSGGGHVNTGTSGDLVIRNASVTGDDGTYSCVLSNTAGNGTAGNITMTVYEKPMITEIGEVVVINVDPLNVSCEVRARPAASVVWKLEEGGDLSNDIFRYDDRTLTVGKYTITTSYLMWSGGQPDDRRGLGRSTIVCKAANAAGASSNTFDLNVQYAPYNVQMNPPEAIVEFGRLGPVLCSAVCNPSCSYGWSKGGAQVSSNATLMIHNVTRDNQGVYKCRPDNRIPGGDTGEFSLTVFYGPAVDAFTIGSPNDPILEGDTVRFTCDTDSRPTPVITMYTPRGDVLASSSHNQSLEHISQDIDCLDAGQYKCAAINSETGKYHSRMTTATVHCAPRKNRTSAREVAATDGDTVSFNITTVAYPQPAFTWFFNGTELSDVSYTIKTHTMGRLEPDVFISSSLTLSNITQENFGNYSVMARNTRGTMDGVLFLLTAVGIPDGPRDVRVAHANAVSITMQWTSGWNRGGEQVFTLMYRRSDSDDSYANITDIGDPGQGEAVTAKAIGLLPDTSYNIIVQATNLYGASQSQLVTHSTKEEPNFGSESDDSFSIVITGGVASIMWSLYKYSGPITHVDVNSCVSDSTNCILTTKVSPTTSTVEVAVPKGGSSYTFEFRLYDGEDLLSTLSHRAGVDGGSPVGIIVGVVVGVMVVIAIAVGGFIYWKRRSQTDVRKDKTNPSELGHVNPVMVTDDDIPLTANGKHDTISEGHQMVVENSLYSSSGPGRDDHMDQPYSEVSVATKAAGEKKKKHKGKKSKQNAVEMNNMSTEADNTKGNLYLEDTTSPYEDVDGTDKPKGAGPVDSQLPMYAEVDRSQKQKKAPELAEYADVDVVKKNKHARKAAKADIVEPEVVEYEEVDFKKKSPGAPAAAGGGLTLGAAALPEYGQVDFSKKHKQESEAAGKPKPPVKGKKPKPGAPPPRPPRAASVDEGERAQSPPDHQPQYGVEGTLYADLDLINTRPTRTEPTVHANLEPSEYASIDALRLTTRPADQ